MAAATVRRYRYLKPLRFQHLQAGHLLAQIARVPGDRLQKIVLRQLEAMHEGVCHELMLLNSSPASRTHATFLLTCHELERHPRAEEILLSSYEQYTR